MFTDDFVTLGVRDHGLQCTAAQRQGRSHPISR